MKKLLALVLALVMTLSLCVTSNAAYKDAADVELKEAVDVLTAIGVFQGDENGNFNAQANLTREQAAKLVAYLQIGQKAADALVGGGKFTDVAKDRWSAGYVDYCASIGIAAGVGDSKFDPTGSLTALQFGKMLLVCLGYDAASEGMVGTDWSINTSKLMASAELLGGLDEVTANSVVTREQAAKMMLNALEAPMVEYENKSTSISVNGADIVFGGSTASYVTDTIASAKNIDNEETNTGRQIIELGEKLFTKLVRDGKATDDFGRPAVKWTYKSKKVGTFAKEADASYTANTKYGDIYADLGLSEATVATVFVDGKTASDIKLTKGDSTKTNWGNGTLVECFTANDKKDVTIVAITTHFAKVGSVTEATSSADRYITLSPDPAVATLDPDFETEAFAKKDLVSFTMAWNGSKYEVQTVSALEKADAGEVTTFVGGATVSGSSVTINGTKYEYAKYAKNADTTVDVEDEFDVYLDAYGYILYMEQTESASNYAVVIGVGDENVYGSSTNGATLMFPDGSIKEVKYEEESGALTANNNVKEQIGDIVEYTIDKNGVYQLTVVDNFDNTKNDKLAFNNKNATLTVDTTTYRYATEETVFVVATLKDTAHADKGFNYNVFVGYENMPNVAADNTNTLGFAYVDDDDNKLLDIVYIAANVIEDVDADDVYVAVKEDLKPIKDSTGTYYEAPAVVNGEKTTVKMKATVYAAADGGNTVDADGKTVAALYKLTGITKNSDDILTSFTAVPAATALTYKLGTKEATKKVVGVNFADAEYLAYNNDTVLFFVDDEYKGFTAAEVASVGDDATDLVYYVMDDDDNYVDTMFIVEQDETVPTYDLTITGDANATYTYKINNGEATTYSALVPNAVKAGDTVVVTATPNPGYTLTDATKATKTAIAADEPLVVAMAVSNTTEKTSVLTVKVVLNDANNSLLTSKNYTVKYHAGAALSTDAILSGASIAGYGATGKTTITANTNVTVNGVKYQVITDALQEVLFVDGKATVTYTAMDSSLQNPTVVSGTYKAAVTATDNYSVTGAKTTAVALKDNMHSAKFDVYVNGALRYADRTITDTDADSKVQKFTTTAYDYVEIAVKEVYVDITCASVADATAEISANIKTVAGEVVSCGENVWAVKCGSDLKVTSDIGTAAGYVVDTNTVTGGDSPVTLDGTDQTVIADVDLTDAGKTLTIDLTAEEDN